jgi:transposase
MAKSYRSPDRDQLMLLPCDVKAWLEPGHLALFVIDAVAAMDTSAFHVRRRLGGAGRQGYDPDMLLALLVYCYAQRERSSRRIEQLCHVDVAVRVICGNLAPDHTVIARFRAEHDAAVREFFAGVLAMCARAGMVSLGTLALDGTKVAANASRQSNRTAETIRAEVDRIVDEAAATDAAEDELFGDARGDELPDQWADPNGRVERLRRCLEQLDREQAEKVADAGTEQRVAKARARVAKLEAAQAAKVAAHDAAAAAGQPRPGRRPQPVDQCGEVLDARRRLDSAHAAHTAATARAARTRSGDRPVRNPTDPDSRLMRRQGEWVQGYNAQTVATADQVIVAAKVVNEPNDVAELVPMITAARRAATAAGVADAVDAILADGGYWSDSNVEAFAGDCDDQAIPTLLVPPPRTAVNDNAQRMRRSLGSEDGKVLYATRGPTIEGTFGHIKAGLGFRQFSRRGLRAADAEWQLICAVKNLLKLHRHTTLQPAPG